MPFKRPPQQESEEPAWQADIERVQKTLQDVLQAISRLSGVDLPGVTSNDPGNSDAIPVLDGKTLKDRIRNDLEAFSMKAASDLARQAEESTRAAFGVLQSEITGEVNQLSKALREKLEGELQSGKVEIDVAQHSRDRVAELVKARTDEFAQWVWLTCKGTDTPIPSQIEALLQPYAAEATAKFAASFQRQVQDLLAGQEQMVEERLSGAKESLEKHITALENASLRICEENSDSITNQSAERLKAIADEVTKGFDNRLGSEVEGAFGRFQTQLAEETAAAREDLQREEEARAGNFKQRLETLSGDVLEKGVSEIAGRIEHTAASMIESSIQHLHHQAEDSVEHSREEIKSFMETQAENVRIQIEDLGMRAHKSLEHNSASVSESLRDLGQEVAAVRDRQIATLQEELNKLTQGCMNSMAERMRQIADLRMEEVNGFAQQSQDAAVSQFASRLQEVAESTFHDVMGRIHHDAAEAGSRVAAGVKAASESMMRELSEKVNASAAVLREEAASATSRIESAVEQSLASYREQLAEVSNAGLKQQQEAVASSVTQLHKRLVKVAELLVPGDSDAQ